MAKIIKETNIPSVWEKTKFHKNPISIKTSWSEEEETEDDINPDKDTEDKNSDNLDRQGIIRKVEGAHLVFKRKNDSGTYDELWMYPFQDLFVNGTLKKLISIKRAILAGTDIPVKDNISPDGTQTVEQKIIGDSQFLLITGLQQ